MFEQVFDGKDVLFIIAHADDEVIFFGSMLVAVAGIAKSITIAVMSPLRSDNLKGVCDSVGATCIQRDCGYYGKDPFEYSKDALIRVEEEIKSIITLVAPNVVVTHGQYTDYPHYHHYHRMMFYACVKCVPEKITLIARGEGEIVCFYKKKVLMLLNLYGENIIRKWSEFVLLPSRFCIVR